MAALVSLSTAPGNLQNHVSTSFTYVCDGSMPACTFLRQHFAAVDIAGAALEVSELSICGIHAVVREFS